MPLVLNKDQIKENKRETSSQKLLKSFVDYQKVQDENIRLALQKIQDSIESLNVFESKITGLSEIETESKKIFTTLQAQITQALTASISAIETVQIGTLDNQKNLVSGMQQIAEKLDSNDISEALNSLTEMIQNRKTPDFSVKIQRDIDGRADELFIKTINP